MKRIFGVTPLDSGKVDIQIRDCVLSPHSNDFEREFGELKSFLYVLRSAEAAASWGLSSCRLWRPGSTCRRAASPRWMVRLRAQAVYARGFCHTRIRDSHHLQGQTEPSGLLRDELLADVVGEAVARVLGLDRKADFARIAACSPERRCALVARILDRDVSEVQSLVAQAAQHIRGGATPTTNTGPTLWVLPPVTPTTSASKLTVDAKPHPSDTEPANCQRNGQ